MTEMRPGNWFRARGREGLGSWFGVWKRLSIYLGVPLLHELQANLLKGGLYGSLIGVTKEDTRISDYTARKPYYLRFTHTVSTATLNPKPV